MKRFSEQLHKKSQTVKMRKAERDDLRERLVSYMEYHPLPAEMKEGVVKKDVEKMTTEPFKVISIPFQQIFKYSSAFAVLALVVVPFVAEKSVPGDTLYAVKVHLNEEVVSTLTFNSFEKIEWETERLNRRIAEARLLASEGLLTEEVEAEVADAVREHTANVQKEIEVLREEDADAAVLASIELDSTLEVQADSLESKDVSEEGGEEGVEIAVLSQETKPVSLIANAINESRGVVTPTAPATSTLPVYDKMMARVEQNTTRIHELITSIQPVLSPEDFAVFSRRSEDIERAILEAVELKEEDEDTARLMLVDVLQRTQRLIVFMTEMEVSKTVNIDTLIPVVLTDEEEQQNIDSINSNLESSLARLETLLLQVEDEEILGKVIPAKEEIELSLKELASSTSEYESYVSKTESISELLNDVLSLLDQHLAPKAEDTTEEPAAIDVEDDVPTSTEEIVVPDEPNEPEDNGSTTEEQIEEVVDDEGGESETSTEEETATEFDITE